MLVLPTALLSLLSAPRPLLPTTARARPVALSVATWDELEARLPSSLAPEPLIVDSALVLRPCEHARRSARPEARTGLVRTAPVWAISPGWLGTVRYGARTPYPYPYPWP